jgi:hypothetical protein
MDKFISRATPNIYDGLVIFLGSEFFRQLIYFFLPFICTQTGIKLFSFNGMMITGLNGKKRVGLEVSIPVTKQTVPFFGNDAEKNAPAVFPDGIVGRQGELFGKIKSEKSKVKNWETLNF